MQRLLILISALALASAGACSSNDGGSTATELIVSGGEASETYSSDDLDALGAVESEFNGTAYAGVPVDALLEDAGFDTESVRAVKAVASDGFTANYDPAELFGEGIIVAYALADGSDMSGEDGSFRMVLPDAEGRLNVRMLIELQVTQ